MSFNSFPKDDGKKHGGPVIVPALEFFVNACEWIVAEISHFSRRIALDAIALQAFTFVGLERTKSERPSRKVPKIRSSGSLDPP
jgi:hypothetical protein